MNVQIDSSEDVVAIYIILNSSSQFAKNITGIVHIGIWQLYYIKKQKIGTHTDTCFPQHVQLIGQRKEPECYVTQVSSIVNTNLHVVSNTYDRKQIK